MLTLNTIYNWFKKPYYFIEDPKIKTFVSLGIGFFITGFLMVLKPSIIKELTDNMMLFSMNSGIIVTVVFLSFFFILTKVFPGFFNNESWTIGKHIITFFCLFMVCSFLNSSFNFYIRDNSLGSYPNFLASLIKVAVFPIVIIIFLDEKYARLKREKNSKELMLLRSKKEIKQKNNVVKIFASNNKEYLSFSLNSLIYVSSQTNYASFFIDEGDTIKERVLRIPLTNVETSLKEYSNIFRCHRSYIINSNRISDITGCARGYYLHFKELTKEIPVSRKFTKKELTKLVA